MKESKYAYDIPGGYYSVSKGVTTKYEWHAELSIKGEKISLGQYFFKRKRDAKSYLEEFYV